MGGDARGAEAEAAGARDQAGVATTPGRRESRGAAGESIKKVTEHEYVVVRDLARVRMLTEILGRIISLRGALLPQIELDRTRRVVARWEMALEDEVDKLQGREKSEGRQ